MDVVTRAVENLAIEWKDFLKYQEIQEERMKSLEFIINSNVKNEVNNMNNIPMIDLTYDAKDADNLGYFMKGNDVGLEKNL